MANEFSLPGYQLPSQPERKCSAETEGFFTPAEDILPQIHSILPRRVLPIVFLPGIMGSNLRMSATRQARLERKNNIAWRPDNLAASLPFIHASAELRQLQLDPSECVVDEYDPVNHPTGDSSETADERHANAEVDFAYSSAVRISSPVLMDDPFDRKPRRTKEQKARERGWGEILFSSYRDLLEMCEERLNTPFNGGRLDPWWKKIVNVAPNTWEAHGQPPLQPLDEKTLLETVKGCWFPVHAFGYNWLQSNRTSGLYVAGRVNKLMEQYKKQGFQCERIILITHSMGGLVARAAIHPQIGKLNDVVLGVVHGVMPAVGAGAAYKRMRCGFEGGKFDPAAKVLGDIGPNVTAVLGNAQGGLELLPSKAYGNHWLQVHHKGSVLQSLPINGDPYEEIYKVQGKWYNLLREEWINPARLRGSSFEATCVLLDRARAFHLTISDTYHRESYAHYGADSHRSAWHQVVWKIEDRASVSSVDEFRIASDSGKGNLKIESSVPRVAPGTTPPQYSANLQPAADPGDQTVPLHSAEHQLRSGKFKGIFRQGGYEHQNSYRSEKALHSTLYCIVRIAHTMEWSK